VTEPPTGAPEAPRIAAVVVTFNRLDLLQRLVERLRAVPQVDEILVIDNASTDGTGQWLSAAAATTATPEAGPELHHRTLTQNSGGAGGFHEGLGWAMERGADLAWLMDDDGLPDADCLGILLRRCGDFDFWGPVVVDEAEPDRLVFPIRLPGGTRVVHEMGGVAAAAADGVIRDVVIPFNGVLVTRELVQRIGTPREEFFIWGDDHEYRLRAQRAGGRVATVVGARVRHPSVGDLGTPMMFGRTTYNHTPSDLKHYCMARNNLVNLREYRGWAHALMFVAKTAWFYAVTRPSAARLRLSAQAMLAGLRGDFTGHRRFLRGPA
jgi:rhamnopyranosyl-N-acetylglucosaminyl-diphospho-decaprenol beta-1,3/1,4-galactofuranosyltransferase